MLLPKGFYCPKNSNFVVTADEFSHMVGIQYKQRLYCVGSTGYVQVLMFTKQLGHHFQAAFSPILEVGVADS